MMPVIMAIHANCDRCAAHIDPPKKESWNMNGVGALNLSRFGERGEGINAYFTKTKVDFRVEYLSHYLLCDDCVKSFCAWLGRGEEELKRRLNEE